jgi:tetratricopeptide (TPR) repeat protein
MIHMYDDDYRRARVDTLRSAEAGRAADPKTRAHAVGNAGFCLASLEREMERAEALLTEASVLAAHARLEVPDIPLGLGHVHAHNGRFDEAVVELERGLVIAERQQQYWYLCKGYFRLIQIDLEHRRWAEARARAAALLPVAAKMGEGSEGPFAVALDALASLGLGDPDAPERVEKSLGALRDVDSKAQTAFALLFAAELDLEAGRPEAAAGRAREALAAAELVDRRSDLARARVILARAALAARDRKQARLHLEPALADLAGGRLAATAREAVERTARALGLSVPTVAPTAGPTRSA